MQKVYVGLSGGVDSAVSAALLKERGYDVTGVFIKIWQPEFIECTWREDRLDAMRVAAHLEIPFKEIDLSAEYKKDVVSAMISDYESGIKPNPDVLCNTHIKFGAFFEWAIREGADFVATGHYAQTKDGRLYRGVDTEKDQSYFLHGLGESQLQRTLFPAGELTKAETRAHARRFALPNAEKPDSQGLCFVGDVSMRDFLARYISLTEGAVLDIRGKSVGVHDGAALYTIGQRHGFNVRGDNPTVTHYVTAVDSKANTITVSVHREDAARTQTLVQSMHWIHAEPSLEEDYFIQMRYREQPTISKLIKKSDRYEVALLKPVVYSKGQSLVVYRKDECLGGGVITDGR